MRRLDAALQDAGVTEEDTTRLRTSKDRDDGRIVYEIQFDANGTEYDYEISAADGTILNVDTESIQTRQCRTMHRQIPQSRKMDLGKILHNQTVALRIVIVPDKLRRVDNRMIHRIVSKTQEQMWRSVRSRL